MYWGINVSNSYRMMNIIEHVYVIIPMYNAENTICTAIESVLSQIGVEIEVVVVDHGSNDRSLLSVINEYGDDERVKVYPLTRGKKEKKSAARPLNYGIEQVMKMSKGCDKCWFVRLDADDKFVSDVSLITLIKYKNEKCRVLGGAMFFYNSSTKKSQLYTNKSQYDSIEDMLGGVAYVYAHHATLISTQLLEIINKDNGKFFDEKLCYGEDLDFSLKILSCCKDEQVIFTHIPIILKETVGETITNTIKLRTLLHDHIRIFVRHKSLSKILFVKLVIWLIADRVLKNNKLISPVKKYLG